MPTESYNNNGDPSTLDIEVVNSDSVTPQVEGAEGLPPGRLRPQTDLFVGIGLMLFGAAASFESWRMPRFEHLNVQIFQAPGFVPGLLGLTIAAFGLMILVRSLREGGWQLAAAGTDIGTNLRSIEARRLAILFVITLGYAWGLVGRIPFWAASFVFVLAFILLFDWREASAHSKQVRLLVTASLQAAITAVVISFVFEYIFRVRLP
mgnify:CR=1 FL=1